MVRRIVHWTLCVCLWFAVVGCNAQSSNAGFQNIENDSLLLVDIDTSYAFIRYDSNSLILGSDSSALRHFAEKWYHLLATGEGNINIVQLGASHIQGGTFPHRVRRNLLINFPNLVGPRGLIFPYSAAPKCNNPYDYKVSRSRALKLTRSVFKNPEEKLGLTGIAVTAADTATDIGITLNEPSIHFETTRIILLGYARGGVVPQLQITDAKGNQQTLSPQTIDTTLRRYTFQLEESVDSFHIVMPCKAGQAFVLTGVYLDNDKPGISYHSIGVNGASLVEYLQKSPYMVQDLKLLHPDLVIFGIGINDAVGANFDTVVFQRRYMQLMDSIRLANPDCAFIFVTNNDSFRRVKRRYEVNPNGVMAREAFLRLGQKTGNAVWDQFTIMGGLNSMKVWQDNALAQRDHIHFTRKGYEMLGDLLTNALVKTLIALKPAEYRTTQRTQDHRNKKEVTTPKENNEMNKNERSDYISY